jgi:hypothetical protein
LELDDIKKNYHVVNLFSSCGFKPFNRFVEADCDKSAILKWTKNVYHLNELNGQKSGKNTYLVFSKRLVRDSGFNTFIGTFKEKDVVSIFYVKEVKIDLHKEIFEILKSDKYKQLSLKIRSHLKFSEDIRCLADAPPDYEFYVEKFFSDVLMLELKTAHISRGLIIQPDLGWYFTGDDSGHAEDDMWITIDYILAERAAMLPPLLEEAEYEDLIKESLNSLKPEYRELNLLRYILGHQVFPPIEI